MRNTGDKKAGISKTSSDEEIAEWYESHEITEHMEDTEEVKADTVIYQDSRGLWYRASDGVHVPSPVKEPIVSEGHDIRIIRDVAAKVGDRESTWTSSSVSYATMLK